MQPSFVLNKYEVISCSYKKNVMVGKGKCEYTINFAPHVRRSEDEPEKFKVEIITTLTGLADVELVVAGYFTSTGLLDEEQLESAILFSSLHLLIPFIRSYIHTISCQDGRPAIVVPVINVADLLPVSEQSDPGQNGEEE